MNTDHFQLCSEAVNEIVPSGVPPEEDEDDVEHEHDGHEELEDEAVVGEARLVVNDPRQGRATEITQGEGGCEQPGHL